MANQQAIHFSRVCGSGLRRDLSRCGAKTDGGRKDTDGDESCVAHARILAEREVRGARREAVWYATAMKRLAILALLLVSMTAPGAAQSLPGQNAPATAGPAAGTIPAPLKGITIQQKLNSQIPLDLHFHDETGRDVALRQYFSDRPVILNLVYFRCGMLCPQVVEGLAHSLKQLTFDAGKQYTVLTVSFDPGDTPAAAADQKAKALKQLGTPDAANGWHFLTGNESSIKALTDAVGFVYRWDPASKQFFHAAGIMVLTPDGKLSRYFYGIDFNSADLRLGLVEASNRRIGSVVDSVLLFCCRFDATSGKYDWMVGRLLSLAGALTILIIGALLFVLARSEPNQPKTS